MLKSFTLPDGVKMTPMLEQFVRWKNEYPEALLFFRMGDFYELFFDDARVASEVLDIALTARDQGKKIPMAGIPHHASESYLGKLIKKGYHVAICEQMTEPDGRSLVDRQVIRLVTPGTYLPEETGNDGRLVAVRKLDRYRWAVGSLEPGTGFLEAGAMPLDEVRGFLSAYRGSEILRPKGKIPEEIAFLIESSPVVELPVEDFDPAGGARWLQHRWDLASLQGFGFQDGAPEIGVAAALLRYLEETQFGAARHVSGIAPVLSSRYLHLDVTTQRNLELFDGDGPSLYDILNRCKTACGRRRLREWITRPLMDPGEISRRLDVQETLLNSSDGLNDLQDGLGHCKDIERSLARLHMRSGNPRDLAAIRDTLSALPSIEVALKDVGLSHLLPCSDDFCDISDLLARGIEDSPSRVLGNGKIVRDGFDDKLDEWRGFAERGQEWLNDFTQRERDRLSIPRLKTGYSRVFGYYLEIGKGSMRDDLELPEDYRRRQTLVSAERYTTSELRDFEERMSRSEEEVRKRETELYGMLLERTLEKTEKLQSLGRALGNLDVLVSLAEVSRERGYIRPEFSDGGDISIKGGRHPVVEAVQKEIPFVPNDVDMKMDGNRLAIVTGPNMAGKSTYLRMTALLVIMAQMGTYIPAESADLGLCDRVFTRLGARDELAFGNSTFMVEMVETANILHNVTDRSLVILDEVGRGTSTYDGMSIAWAVLEYLQGACGRCPKVLFATHYHELTALEGRMPHVFNLRVEVEERPDGVTFLHRVIPGPADRSYGVEVARLAGLPRVVLCRAQELLERFEKSSDDGASVPGPSVQMEFFDLKGDAIIQELASLSPDDLTPIQALEKVYELHEEARKAVKP